MKIKKYEPELTAHVKSVGSPTGASVGAAMGELKSAGRAFSELGESLDRGITKVGSTIEKILEKKQEEKQNREYIDSVTTAEEAWQGFKSDMDKINPDPDDYVESAKQGWDTIIEEQEKKIQDSVVRKTFKTRMSQRWLSIMPGVTNDATKIWLDRESATKIEQAERFKGLAEKAPNKTDFELHKARMIDVFRNSTFIFGETKALTLEKTYTEKLDQDRQVALKDQLLARVLRDPTMAQIDIASGTWDELNEADREVLREKAVTHERSWLALKRAEEERIKKQNHDNEELEIHRLYATGKLTTEDLLGAKFISGDERYIWEQRAMARGKAPVLRTNFEIKAKLREGIQWIETPEDLNQYIKLLSEASDKNIKQEDAEELLEKAMNRIGGVEGEHIKRAHREFRAELAPTSDVLGLPRVPEEEEAVSKAQNLLDQEIVLARKRGKPLSGIEIYQKGREILRMPGLKVEDKPGIIKGKAKAEREARRARREGQKPTAPRPLKKENETIAEYLKRIGVQ